MAVVDRVRMILCEQLGVDEYEVTPGASVIDDLGADSLDTIEIVMALEEEFRLDISDEDAERCTCVREITEYLEMRLKK